MSHEPENPSQSAPEYYVDEAPGEPAVRGFLHRPAGEATDGLILTHGAGANCNSPLLRAIAEAFANAGFLVLRCDLPFRQKRPHGPPMAGDSARDRQGIRRAVTVMRRIAPGRLFLGGHSYGGRQATILAAEEQGLADGLLLFSYPLHPPRKPDQLRTQHFPKLKTDALFVHGSRDPFASLGELGSALKLIPARTDLVAVEGAGHDLGFGARERNNSDLPSVVVKSFVSFSDV